MSTIINELAHDIMNHVGGKKNVKELRHCITRLRFKLKDETLADTDYLKKRDGIVTVIQSGGQYQIVIGNHVAEVYDQIVNKYHIGEESEGPEDNDNEKLSLLDRGIELITGLFQPFLGVLIATGMLKGFVAILGSLGMNAGNSGVYAILNASGDAFFQYLPVFLAITGAKKFKLSLYTSLAIAVAFLYPSLSQIGAGDALYTLFVGTPIESAVSATFLGIPIILPPTGNYYSTVIPVIFAIWLGSKVEKQVKRFVPKIVNTFLTPFFTILITVPISLILIGPIATWASSLIGWSFDSIYSISPVLFGTLVAGLWQILVMFGLHWGLIPVVLLQLSEQGFTPITAAIGVASFGVLGVLFGLIIKAKDKKIKQLSVPAAISTFFGITEPAVYGILLPMKRPFIIALVASAVGGAYTGFFDIVAYRLGGLGIFSIPSYITETGAITINFWHRLISFALTTVVAFIITMVVKLPKIESDDGATGETNETIDATYKVIKAEVKHEIIASPLTGNIVKISDVPDELFASETLGKGIAIMPSKGIVSSPTNATVTTLFPTGHAIGLTTENGTEILIHIGIDTVQLEGKGFEKLVSQGDQVRAGQDLVKFDMNLIKEAGLSIITPVVITNSTEYTDILVTQADRVEIGDYLITSVK